MQTRVEQARRRLRAQRRRSAGSRTRATRASSSIFATENPELRHKGIAAFIVDRDAPGVSASARHEDKLGQRASDTAQVMLRRRARPHGERARAARATASSSRWRPSTRRAPTSARARAASCAAASTSASPTRRSARRSARRSRNHQLVQAMIAEMAIRIEATRLLVPQGRVEPRQRRARSARLELRARPTAPTARCRRRSTRCRSSAATAT